MEKILASIFYFIGLGVLSRGIADYSGNPIGIITCGIGIIFFAFVLALSGVKNNN